MKRLIFAISILIITGCASTTIDPVVEHYNQEKYRIKLGISMGEFQTIFSSTQDLLSKMMRKPAERFTKNGNLYDVIYIRSARIPDGATTDDEFTPYIFINDKLAEIGWASIGGMKRTSNDIAKEKAELEKAKASATKIEQKIEQSVEIK